ncbi:putative lyase [Symmachiella macrocystis]|uniref:Putative lyase n=1 Tax=Symmachiella macrocystis TaxID=2527985 RepID=A0A5C6BKV4_9PLAN|nr:putative lyase [Symmachiella macrocystis]
MLKKSWSASRLLSVVTALAVIPIFWPTTVSAGWFKGLFHKENRTEYDPVKISPHCQQYYGYFPTCWRVFPQDFQNCPPGGYCPSSPMMMQPQYPGDSEMPVDVPAPEPADDGDLPVDTGDVPAEDGPPPVPPALPYEEPADDVPTDINPVPDISEDAPALDLPPEVPPIESEPVPANDEEASSDLFLPPRTRRQVNTTEPTTTASEQRATQVTRKPRQMQRREPLVRLETIETPAASDIAIDDRRPTSTFPTTAPALPIPLEAEGDVADLLHALRDPSSPNRDKLVYRLGMMKKEAAPAVPALTVLLHDADAKVRMHSALALWRITHKTEFAVPTLSNGLSDGTNSVQSLAAVALGEIGPPAEKAVPMLVSASECEVTPGNLQAAEALWKVAGKNANSIAVLTSALDDADADVRWVSAYALAEIAPNSNVVVKALAGRLSDENARVREVSAFALGAVGSPSKTVVPELLEAMNDDNPGVRNAATRALLLIDP